MIDVDMIVLEFFYFSKFTERLTFFCKKMSSNYKGLCRRRNIIHRQINITPNYNFGASSR